MRSASRDPAAYDAWYHTRRGRWIARREAALLTHLLAPAPGGSLLDVGTGTGEFCRTFGAAGLAVTALDPSASMLGYARQHQQARAYVLGRAESLPFADGTFDYCAAVTSLCFVPDPAHALAEMWRVCRRGVVLGLLNRRSLLHRRKANSGGYRGARWDSIADVRRWVQGLSGVGRCHRATAIHLPGGGPAARLAERLLPSSSPWGGFLAVAIRRT